MNQLTTLAKELGVTNYSKMGKAQLADALEPKIKVLDQRVVDDIIGKTNNKEAAKRASAKHLRDLGKLSYLTKEELEVLDRYRASKRERRVYAEARQGYIVGYNARTRRPRIPRAVQRETAARGALKTFTIQGRDLYDATTFLNNSKHNVITKIKNEIGTGMKAKLVLTCEMSKTNVDTGEVTIQQPHFRSYTHIILASTNLSEIFNKRMAVILETIAKYQKEGSNWKFERVVRLDIHIDKYDPLRGSSYIDLAKFLKDKKAIINVQNNDNECFKWAVTSALYPVKESAKRVSKYLENSQNLPWTGITFPTSLKDIRVFEKNNQDVAINVLSYDSKERVYPLRLSQYKNRDTTINLLLIDNGKVQHYCWVKNMRRLLSAQTTRYNGERFYCLRCLNGFWCQKALSVHEEYSGKNEPVKIELPSEGKNILKFKNHQRKMRVPFVVYADFECFTKKLDGCQPSDNGSYTLKRQVHQPSGFCYYFRCFNNNAYEPVLYSRQSEDEDLGKIFIDQLEADIKKLYSEHKFVKPMVMTSDNEIEFSEATRCHICELELKGDVVRDHCHLTGEYRGAAHSECNLKYRVPKFYPVFFHNLSNYDAHIFVKSLGGDITAIPCNEERYVKFVSKLVKN